MTNELFFAPGITIRALVHGRPRPVPSDQEPASSGGEETREATADGETKRE